MRALRVWLTITALCAAGVHAESRISVLVPHADSGASASARLNVEVVVPRVLMLDTASGGAQAWANFGTIAAQCAQPGSAACRAGAVYGGAGVNNWNLPGAAPTIAQP